MSDSWRLSTLSERISMHWHRICAQDLHGSSLFRANTFSVGSNMGNLTSHRCAANLSSQHAFHMNFDTATTPLLEMAGVQQALARSLVTMERLPLHGVVLKRRDMVVWGS